MVQSEARAYKAVAYAGSPSRSELSSKRAGFENMQKQEQIRKISASSSSSSSSAQSAKQQAAKAAANNFGPMFRDRDHFISLHHC